MSSRLKALATGCDVGGDLAVLALESGERFAELRGFAPALNFDLAGQRLELVDIAGANLLLDRQ